VTTFANSTNPGPTSFGFYDSDVDFITEADSMLTFVKGYLGDDILSVELTNRQIWRSFEYATSEYGKIINEYQAKSQLVSFLGYSTGSLEGHEEKYIRENLEFLTRNAEPYAMEAGIGGSYDSISGSIKLEVGRQDYNLYTELLKSDGTVVFDSALGKLKIEEVFHFDPQAAYRFFDTTSAINYLNNEFSFESFTPETIFYILPVYEDILRAGQLDVSNRVRRSNYSYKIMGTNLRIYPIPTTPTHMIVRVRQYPDPTSPAYEDGTIAGVSNLNNIPFGNLTYARINSIGRQWIRRFTLAVCMEKLGYVRGKISNIPIPGAEVTLNHAELISNGRADKEQQRTELREMLDSMTYDKLMEMQASRAENIQKQLKFIPIPNGKAIFMG
tara:strand:- start:5367 stop:6524 length:1158 start_codon:yes stop_codon:yes gene_type:complete